MIIISYRLSYHFIKGENFESGVDYGVKYADQLLLGASYADSLVVYQNLLTTCPPGLLKVLYKGVDLAVSRITKSFDLPENLKCPTDLSPDSEIYRGFKSLTLVIRDKLKDSSDIIRSKVKPNSKYSNSSSTSSQYVSSTIAVL